MPDAPAPGFASRPGYELEVVACPKRVRTAIAGIVLADSTDTVLVLETGHPPVYYFPKSDVRIDEFLRPTGHRTTCPFKGAARYWSFHMGETMVENVAWAYDDPYREAAALRDHVAFYWDKMDVWFEDDEQVHAHPADPRTGDDD